jgi:hypothetical protein
VDDDDRQAAGWRQTAAIRRRLIATSISASETDSLESPGTIRRTDMR